MLQIQSFKNVLKRSKGVTWEYNEEHSKNIKKKKKVQNKI